MRTPSMGIAGRTPGIGVGFGVRVASPSPLLTNVLASWSVDEASGTRVDALGLSSLTPTNTPTNAAGRVGNAANFVRASNQHLLTPHTTQLAVGDQDFTVAAWVWFDSKPGDMGIIAKWESAKQQWALWYNHSTQQLGFIVDATGGNTTFGQAPSGQCYQPATGYWHLLIAWHDSVNNKVGVRWNNGYDEQVSYSSGVASLDGALIVGALVSSGIATVTKRLDGRVDQPTYWNRLLTNSEKQMIWNGGAGQAYPWATPYVATRPNILFDGNSLVNGAYYGYEASMPYQCVPLLGTPVNWRNFGLSGQNTSQMITAAPTRVDPFYDSSASKNIVVAWEIHNSLTATQNPTTAYNNLVTYCQARRTAGFQVVVVTGMRAGGAVYANFNTHMDTVNTNIRANWATFADAIADVGANATIGTGTAYLNSTYFRADQIHLTPAGYGVAASVIAPVIAGLL